MTNLDNFEFISKSHLRYENGSIVKGLQVCGRSISIKKNIDGCKGYNIPVGFGYIITIFDLEGNHPIWGTNVIVSPKPMKIINQSSEERDDDEVIDKIIRSANKKYFFKESFTSQSHFQSFNINNSMF